MMLRRRLHGRSRRRKIAWPSGGRGTPAALPADQIDINYPEWDTFAPFGSYKQSGNGREYADWAIHDVLALKGIIGCGAA